MSEGLSDAVNVPSPAAGLPHRHRTKLYTAYLDMDATADSSAPMPVDLVSSLDTGNAPQSAVHADSTTQPAALQVQSSRDASTAPGTVAGSQQHTATPVLPHVL